MPLQRIASQTQAIQIKHNAMWGEFLSLSLSLSRLSKTHNLWLCPQFVSRFINSFFSDNFFNSFKFFKFLKFFNPFCSFLWIATKSQATSRNDEWAKIHKFTLFFHKIHNFHNFSFLWILLRATHSQHIFCYAKNRYACAATPCVRKARNYNNFHTFLPVFRSVQTDKKFILRRKLCFQNSIF